MLLDSQKWKGVEENDGGFVDVGFGLLDLFGREAYYPLTP